MDSIGVVLKVSSIKVFVKILRTCSFKIIPYIGKYNKGTLGLGEKISFFNCFLP